VPLWNYLAQGGKRACCKWHRRSGKDDVMLHHNSCAAFERVGNYWYMLPKYKQARKALWTAINPHTGRRRIDEAFPLEIREKTLDNEMFIEFKNGSTWQLMGSDNYDSLVGSPPIGLTFSEYAISNPSAWGFLRPIMLENGGWAIFNSTPRGKNHFKKLTELAEKSNNWFYSSLTVDDTGCFSSEELLGELEELQSEHGDDYGKAIWLQEYYVSFEAAIPGAIWGAQLTKVMLEGRIGNFPHVEGSPVFTAWDIGRSDMTSVWFYQMVNRKIRVIDFYQDNFKEIEDHCDVLKEKAKDLGYDYGLHWLPHDARPLRLGMGGKTILQQFLDQDAGDFVVHPRQNKEDGIASARNSFSLCEFNEDTTEEGFEHLKSYARTYDEEKKVFSTTPVHDEHSHPADAFILLGQTWRQSKMAYPELTDQEKLHAGNITNIKFGEIRKNHFRKKRNERAGFV
jgi:hypothetical protein